MSQPLAKVTYRGSRERCNDQGVYSFNLDNSGSLPNLSRTVFEAAHTNIPHLMMKKLVRLQIAK